MAKDGVYAADLKIGDVVRLNAQIWRVARVDRYGNDEVEVVLVTPEDNDQLVLNMNPGPIVELITKGLAGRQIWLCGCAAG